MIELMAFVIVVIGGAILWESEKMIQEKKDNERGDKQ